VTVDLGLLRRRREFGLLVLGQTVSELGSMATFVAIPFQAYDLTGSSLAVGLLGVAEFAPIIVLALVGGALADAFDRRRLVQIAEVGAAVVAGALLVNATLPDPHLWVLYVCSALLAAFTAMRRPPLDALIPRLVERDELKAASALQFGFHNMASLAGPALAGVLIAAAGLTATYGVDVVSFAASLVVLNAMRTPPPPPDAEAPSWRTIREGLRYATSRQDLVGTYLVDMNAMFFGMPMALFPAIAKGYGGPEVLGLLYAAPSAGSVVVTLTSGWSARVHRHGRAVAFGAALWGVAIVGFGFATPCGWPSRAWSWRARWTPSAASSARRSGTRRSPITCAGAWLGWR
jgi:MFS family permease